MPGLSLFSDSLVNGTRVDLLGVKLDMIGMHSEFGAAVKRSSCDCSSCTP
eukprot:m.167648 g.167648  ORF g.167648 m.167648 type:complete len:50 (-) comp31469_c0_seq2:1507-1656(-)